MFEKHTIYAVVSISSLIMDAQPQAKVESYHLYENAAQSEADKMKTWKTTAVVPYEVSIPDLVRVLNKGLEA